MGKENVLGNEMPAEAHASLGLLANRPVDCRNADPQIDAFVLMGDLRRSATKWMRNGGKAFSKVFILMASSPSETNETGVGGEFGFQGWFYLKYRPY